MRLSATDRRYLRYVAFLAGVAHLVAPGVLLGIARRGYRVLDVEFAPKAGAKRRVQLVGVGVLALVAWWTYAADST